MRLWLAKRIIISIVLFFCATVVVYLLAYSAPGDPVYTIYGIAPGHYSLEDIEIIRRNLGLDQPVYIQYSKWISLILQGDFGRSYVYNHEVSDLIAKRLVNTVRLQGVALILSMLIGIPTGVIAAVKQNSKTDTALTSFAVFGFSMPQFWFGIMLLLLFGVVLGWLPTGGMATLGQDQNLLDMLLHMVLPVTTLALTYSTCFTSRLTRSCMLEVLRQDYILVARAKGLRDKIVIWKHALRNALLPVITIVGLYLAYMFAGAAIVETVFSWPGIGSLMVRAATDLDYAVIMGVNVVTAIVIIISVLVTDIVYAFIDPRVRYG